MVWKTSFYRCYGYVSGNCMIKYNKKSVSQQDVKINMQTLWSYTNNNFLENIRGRPFIIATKYIKCIVLNVKNLYEENLKHFQKSTQIVFNKCKDTLFS